MTGEAPSAAPQPAAAPRTRRWHLARAALVVALAVGGLWTTTHGVGGVVWSDVAAVVLSIPLRQLGVLAVIWFSGLAVYSTVLSAALPGLGARRGLLLNLTGSAVANVLPLGGAVATSLNWRMTRRWGHSTDAFIAYCVVTNTLGVITKLLLPLIGVAVLTIVSIPVSGTLWTVAGGCAGALTGLATLGAAGLRHSSRRTSGRLLPLLPLLQRLARDSGGRIRVLVARSWSRMLSGSLAYTAAQVLLLYVSLHSVGLRAPVSTVLMAAGIERLGTLVPITPAGTGIAEIGTVAWLLASGQDPAMAVAGVLVYRVFLVAMEVPIGGMLLGGWWWFGRGRSPGVVPT